MAQRRERSADLGPEVAAAASALRALVDAWTLRALPLLEATELESPADVLAAHSTVYELQKYAVARRLDRDAAFGMWRRDMLWRLRTYGGVDSMPERITLPAIYISHAVRVTPSKRMNYTRDREGGLVWVASSGMFQGAAFEALVGARCMVWTTVYVMEVIRSDLRRHFNANVELDDPRLTIIADLAEFDYWRSPYSMGLAKQLALLVQEHYPEVMKRFLIVNAPWAFSAVWAVVKHFFDAAVVAKCALVGAASTHDALLEHIADDQIPQYLGGAFVPPDGDPECANFFCRCGALPDDAAAEPELDAAVEGMTIELADIE
jgi:hypothetical protein